MPRKQQGPVTVETGKPEVDPQPAEGTTETPAPEAPETSPTAPAPIEGQTLPDQPTSPPESVPGESVSAEESFFDPRELDPKLIPAYKQMQGTWTKKMQALGKDKEKIQAYDAFFSDPLASLQQTAERYGMRMEPIRGTPSTPGTPAEAPTTGTFGADWQPQTWDEVLNAFAPKIINQIQSTLQTTFKPVMENLRTLTTSNVERQLSEIDPQWRAYEDAMTETLRIHPTLANDVSRLYRISVPEEVLTARATQAALKKFENKAKDAKIQGKSSVKQPTKSGRKVGSFEEAVIAAREEIGSE